MYLTPIKFFEALLEAVEKLLDASTCSVYMLQGEVLGLHASRGWENIPYGFAAFRPDTGIWNAAIENRITLTLPEFLNQYGSKNDLPAEGPFSLICGPLFCKGEMVGLVNVERMPFEKYQFTQ